jgi:glycosyltransferase involved in cell wall biosynthesis
MLKWYSPKACDCLREIEHQWKPQLVLLESSYLFPYRVLFDCPVIFGLHNIESELVGNFAKSRVGLVAWAGKLEAALMQKVEAAIPQHAYGVTTVSEGDRKLLQQISNSNSATSAKIVAAPNGVTDEAFLVKDESSSAAAPTVVFIAHLGWRPNIDGARWLAEKVWPIVLRQHPNARLELIGRSPASQVLSLADPKLGVWVHGDVDSVFPYLAHARVATAPLWTAGGTRLKILEALATGTPVVATSLGALGLEDLAKPDVLEITDDPTEFAQALANALSRTEKSAAASQAAEAFRWSMTLRPLMEMVESATNS